MANPLSHSMFPWLRLKRGYTDIKTLRDRKWWQKERQQCIWSARVPSRGLLETYLNVYSHARDHSRTQTKSHVDPCRNHWAIDVTVKQTDGQTDRQTSFQLYIVDRLAKCTCPVVQAGACHIQSRLTCCIQSRLRRSHTSILTLQKVYKPRKKFRLRDSNLGSWA